MEKIKITLTSGASLEKPLVTAFKVNEGTFVVLDNEANGTMGLPIILVSKFENNKLTYIEDAEWESIKQTLRMIIGGNQMDYVTVPKEIIADDNFFKQLTLPVASFDTLKNNYKQMADGGSEVQTEVAPATPMVNEAVSVESVMPTPMPSVEPTPAPIPEPMPVSEPVVPEQVVPQAAPVEAPVTPVAPVIPEAPAVNQEVASVSSVPTEPVMPTSVPNVEPIPEVAEEVNVDFTADKEAFLKACENMFDALVAKFKN